MAHNTKNKLFRAMARYSYPPTNPLEAPEDRERGGRRKRRRGMDGGPEFHPVDVVCIRQMFNFTQREFALVMGISPETLRNWEKGRRHPCGPSRALLRLMQAEPSAVAKVLSWHRMSELPNPDH